MRVIYDNGKVSFRLKNTVVAIGIFDGVHLGHRLLIEKMVRMGKERKLKTVVVTFHPHPAEVLRNVRVDYLVSLDRRVELLKSLGVDYVWVIKFSKKFAHLKPQEFVEKYLIERFGVKEVFVGDDFRFGENRTGDIVLFEKLSVVYGFKLHHIQTMKRTEHKISSSRLRELIQKGKLREASLLLGRNVSVFGKVVKGQGLGKKIGYPTANIIITSGILPACGVYVVEVFLGGRRMLGMCNIGCRPSIEPDNELISLEVHLLDFNKNIYHRNLVVEFLKKIRNEKKFSSIYNLAIQIKRDESFARQYFQLSLGE